ncbi:MAG: MFS transporter [Acidiferrobacterales bacterium]|nr:MFS transporter [Acidiferrobacterales bacterium]
MRFFPQGFGTVLTMMLTMAVGSSAILSVAVSAPDSAPEIGVRATHVGLFTGAVYFVAMFSGSFCPGFIVKYGPIRVLQATTLLSVLGLLVFTLASPLAVVMCAILLGIAYGPINPANAPVLLAVTNSGNRAFMFSIKQSGVTVGGVAAALLVPLVAVWLNWKMGIISVALLGIATLIILQPLRRQFDSTRINVPLAWSFATLIGPVRQIMRIPLLRGFATVGFTYAGVQICISSFFVVFLVQQGFTLVEAGVCFLFVNIGGIIGRIAWGGISDKWLTPKYTLTVIGVISAVSLSGIFAVTDGWHKFFLYIFSFILGSSTHGWNGVFLSEVANHAPQGESHNWTGGVQFLIYGGVAVLPPLFGFVILTTGGYTVPFLLIALCVFLASISLLWLYHTYSSFH